MIGRLIRFLVAGPRRIGRGALTADRTPTRPPAKPHLERIGPPDRDRLP